MYSACEDRDFYPQLPWKIALHTELELWLHGCKDYKGGCQCQAVAFVKGSMFSGVAAEQKCSYGHVSICGVQIGEMFRGTSVLMWLHTDMHPLHARWVHIHAAGWKKQVSNLASVCIPHEIDSKVGWLPPQTSAVREGWHRDAHSPEGEEDRCEQESPSVPRESQLCLTKCGGGGGGCAAIQPYGSKHLPHTPRRGGIKKA